MCRAARRHDQVVVVDQQVQLGPGPPAAVAERPGRHGRPGQPAAQRLGDLARGVGDGRGSAGVAEQVRGRDGVEQGSARVDDHDPGLIRRGSGADRRARAAAAARSCRTPRRRSRSGVARRRSRAGHRRTARPRRAEARPDRGWPRVAQWSSMRSGQQPHRREGRTRPGRGEGGDQRRGRRPGRARARGAPAPPATRRARGRARAGPAPPAANRRSTSDSSGSPRRSSMRSPSRSLRAGRSSLHRLAETARCSP